VANALFLDSKLNNIKTNNKRTNERNEQMQVMDSFIFSLLFFSFFCFFFVVVYVILFSETVESLEEIPFYFFNFKQNTYLDIDSLVYQFPCKKARNSVAIAYIFLL